MTNSRILVSSIVGLLLASSLAVRSEDTVPALSSVQAIVSVADQKIVVLRDGGVVAKYPISTSRFGVGDQANSYRTPLGKLRVCEKLGDNLPVGAVIKHRRATGEVISVNAPGRDPIVTRVLWLDGTEPQNEHAKDRSIYIHGTPEEKLIGRPASYGCIRMRSKDVMALYADLSVGAPIDIIPEKLPRLAKYVPPALPKMVAKVTPPEPKAEPAPATLAKAAEANTKEHETEAKPAPIPASTAKAALALTKSSADTKAAEARLLKAAGESRMAEARASEAKAAESRKAEAKLAEEKAAESRKEEAKLAEAKATESKKAEAKQARVAAATELKPIASESHLAEAKAGEAKRGESKKNEGKTAHVAVNPEPKVAEVSKPEKPAPAPVHFAKVEPVPARPVAAKPTVPTAKPLVAVAALADDGRSASVRKRPLETHPAVPVDPERLAFIRNHEASLASVKATPEMMSRTDGSSTTVDLSARMKGSILDTGLTR